MNLKFLKAIFTSVIIASTTANANILEVDFTTLYDNGDFKAIAGQNATGSMNVDNDVLSLAHNSWYYVNLQDAIGESKLGFQNTILSFDFKATGTPEIGGVSTTNYKGTGDVFRTFNLVGSQNWGLDNFTYDSIGEWAHFDINLTNVSQDSFSKLVFVNDCDNCGLSDINVSFKNMAFTQVPEPTTMALFALATLGLVSRKIKK